MSDATPPTPADDASRLADRLRDARPDVRRAAVEEVAGRPLAEVRSEALSILSAGTWAERETVLRAIRTARPRSNAREVLQLLRDGGADLDAADPLDREGTDFRSVLLAELGQCVLELGDVDRAVELCQRALEAAPPGVSRGRARAMHHLGLVQLAARRFDAAQRTLGSALGQYRRLDDLVRAAHVLDSLGNLQLEKLELEEAEALYRESLALKTGHGDVRGQAIAHGNLGRIALLRGEVERAIEHFYEDLKLSEQIGDLHGQSIMGNQLGLAYLALGDLERAWDCVQAGTAAARQSGRRGDLGHCARVLGQLALEREDHATAREQLESSLAVFESIGDEDEVANTQLLLGALCRAEGDLDAARHVLGEAWQGFRQLGLGAGEARACLELSLVEQRAGDDEGAGDLLEKGLERVAALDRTTVRDELHRMHAHLRAGRLLLEAGVADRGEIERLIETSYRTGRGLGRLLLDRDLLDSRRFERFLHEKLGVDRMHAASLAGPGVQDALQVVPRSLAHRLRLLPLQLTHEELVVGTDDPLDFQRLERLQLAVKRRVRAVYVKERDLEPALRQALSQSGHRLRLERAGDVPAAMTELVRQAVKSGASDIHVEPCRDRHVVRLRVDGVLHEVDELRLDVGRRLVSRAKTLSGMDPATHHVPQDGALREEIGDRTWRIRLSVIPAQHGENLVMRLLETADALRLEELGFDATTTGRLRRVAGRQEGMLLVVGPTGCGKSTTLNALVREMDVVQRSVFTVEDPIEYEIPGVVQSQVAPAQGYGFAEALKGLLRQDPNVILLGEMRDVESASIATRMALTGHLVLTTLHTYDAPTAVTRLVQMGLPRYAVAAVLQGVLAQRLVRKLCLSCRTEVRLEQDWLRRMEPGEGQSEMLRNATVYGPGGCPDCRMTGYRGRTPLYEYLEVDALLGARIREGASELELLTAARGRGFRPIQASALRRVAAGETSPDEVMRVL